MLLEQINIDKVKSDHFNFYKNKDINFGNFRTCTSNYNIIR